MRPQLAFSHRPPLRAARASEEHERDRDGEKRERRLNGGSARRESRPRRRPILHDQRVESEQARLLLTARLQEQAAQLQETVAQRTRELREANEGLRAAAESNALLALVAQNTTNGVIITDAAGRIEWANGAFTRGTGYELAEVKGRQLLNNRGANGGPIKRPF